MRSLGRRHHFPIRLTPSSNPTQTRNPNSRSARPTAGEYRATAAPATASRATLTSGRRPTIGPTTSATFPAKSRIVKSASDPTLYKRHDYPRNEPQESTRVTLRVPARQHLR